MKNLTGSLSPLVLKGLACIATCHELPSWEAEREMIKGMWLVEKFCQGREREPKTERVGGLLQAAVPGSLGKL